MALTVQEVIDRMLERVPGAPFDETVDTLKSGSPDAVVKGIVTTFITTMDVLRRAVELGANLVITHEPTFYKHEDDTGDLGDDPVVAAKRAYMEENGLCVFRFHDYWHGVQPDGVGVGVTRALGWTKYEDPETECLFHLPPTTLRELAREVKAKLGADPVRVVGDPGMACSTVSLMMGAVPCKWQVASLRREGVDVLVCGEAREWETYEYARDACALGMGKALIVAGHCVSEEPGMDYLVEWLGEVVPEVTATFVPAGSPAWTV
jgi:putative NIF3 family GTP cyclohydrolase 1 type 2